MEELVAMRMNLMEIEMFIKPVTRGTSIQPSLMNRYTALFLNFHVGTNRQMNLFSRLSIHSSVFQSLCSIPEYCKLKSAVVIAEQHTGQGFMEEIRTV